MIINKFDFSFQHYLTMFGATLSVPLIVAPELCIGNDYIATAELLGTILFVAGLVTILQSTIGSRYKCCKP